MARILLVDDEPLVTETLQTLILKEMPELEVTSVNSAVHARELLDRSSYDLVVTDVSMPRISGLELLDHIRKRESPCYVIVLTAYSSFEYAYTAARYENVRFILKIEPPEIILEAIRNGLKHILPYFSAAQNSRRITLSDAMRWHRQMEERNLPELMADIRGCILREGYPQGRQTAALLLQMQLREVFGENCLKGIDINGLPAESVLLHIHYDSVDAWLDAVRALPETLFSGTAFRSTTDTEEMLNHVNRYIQEHYQEPISLAMIAEKFSYNSSYLSRIYKQYMQEGLNEHISHTRIEAACRLLGEGETSISRIAEHCGFQTTKYFITVFKRFMGVTPKSWQKAQFSVKNGHKQAT